MSAENKGPMGAHQLRMTTPSGKAERMDELKALLRFFELAGNVEAVEQTKKDMEAIL